MKFQLLRQLLEWRIEIDHNWLWKPGAARRGLKNHLDNRTWSEFAGTYVGEGIDENWDALFGTAVLFRTVAKEVGNALGYRYPSDLDELFTRDQEFGAMNCSKFEFPHQGDASVPTPRPHSPRPYVFQV